MSFIEFVEKKDENYICKVIDSVNLSGNNSLLMREFLNSELDCERTNDIFVNSLKALKYFADPFVKFKNLSKILCLGKVQSGKTSFYLTDIAISFDNNYKIAYILGGTKNTLKDQTFERVNKTFSNNNEVVVLNLNNTTQYEIKDYLNEGKKVIVVCLKNASEFTNLGRLNYIVNYLSDEPTLLVDDEGDEFSPGAPKLKRKNPNAGKTHDYISNILNTLNICTYLSVTATPQANLLLPTIDEISPDYIVLVEPGKGYCGGNAFHDTADNVHVCIINDEDDFEECIPESFKTAFIEFISSCACLRMLGNTEPFSMLVHPSSLKKIHAVITERIEAYFSDVKRSINDSDDLSNQFFENRFREFYAKYMKDNLINNVTFADFCKEVTFVLNNFSTLQYNSSVKYDEEPTTLYKAYVGGNMLGRGLTIKNLIITYIYRDSTETAIDTLYQRARRFGYKEKYFYFCKVYITSNLNDKFMATVDNENDMWNSIRAFLLSNINAKKFPRLFTIEHDKLKLTRKTVSNTITLTRINPGFNYDKMIQTDPIKKIENRKLFEKFFSTYFNVGYERQFDIKGYQTHFIINISFTEFFDKFLSKYNYPLGSEFGIEGFEKIKKDLAKQNADNDLSIIIMRYKNKERRSLANPYRIKELLQSYDNNTTYPGDKNLTGFSDKVHFQIHLVYLEDGKENDYMPMLAFNNPFTTKSVRYVTGDNDYE